MRVGRRKFCKSVFATATSVAFLETLFTSCSSRENRLISETNQILDSRATQVLNHWSNELNEICRDLNTNKLSPLAWQEQIEKLYGQIELGELAKFIDYEKLSKRFDFPDLGVSTKVVNFPKIDGLGANTVFHKKIFGMKKGRAIIPHGHSNMASAHLFMQGELYLRHFEKLEDQPDHLIIKPSKQRSIQAGDFSTISDERDNVHWFVASSDAAFTFDVIMTDLNGKRYDIHNVDIDGGEKLSGDLLRVQKLDVSTALKKYGKDHHQNMKRAL